MFVLRIKNPKAPPDPVKVYHPPHTAEHFTSKQSILDRHLAKCFFKVGDTVRIKRPKGIRGTAIVKGISEFAQECDWSHSNMVPQFISVERMGTKGPTVLKVGVKQIKY